MKVAVRFTVLLWLILGAGCRNDGPITGDATATEPYYLNTNLGVAYVGKEACKDCHLPQYDTYMQTAMGQSFRAATLSNSHANFENPDPIYDPHNDLYYQPFHRGEELFVMEYRLDGRDTVHKRIEQIDYIVGSGHHTNSHMMDVNGYVYQVPVTYYTQDGRWDLAPGFSEKNTRFNRAIALECMTCHNARPGFVMHSENKFTRIPLGIDCEQCHGPGALHVEWMNTGRLVDTTKAIDYSIVNPRRLPPEQQYMICQRCHMQGAAILKENKSFLDFRPGNDLTEVLNVFWPRSADSVQHFIMASHPDRLEMSACFTETWKEGSKFNPLTCVTCHNPHEDPALHDPNASCNTCHTPEHDTFCTESEQVRGRNNNDCVQCHMPQSGSIDIPHVRITDHYIRIPDSGESVRKESGALLTAAEIADQQEFFGLRSLIDPDPTNKDVADGYLTFYEQFISHPRYLDSADVFMNRARTEVPVNRLTSSLIRLWFLKGDHGAIVNFASDLEIENLHDTWTLYRIGEAYYKTGNIDESIRYYSRAVNLAPDHLRFLDKLGQAYVSDRQLDTAISLFDRVIQANPAFGTAYNNRGFARVMQGQFDLAEKDFLMALSIDPDAVLALANIASLYLNTGRASEGIPYAIRLTEIDPQNQQYQRLLQVLTESS